MDASSKYTTIDADAVKEKYYEFTEKAEVVSMWSANKLSQG
jgi:hypothetical protein